MLKPKSKWLVSLVGALLFASSALAQDNKALLDTLVQKGYLTNADVAQIQSENAAAAKSASKTKTTVSGKMYIDISNITAKTASGAKVNPSGDGLDVKRFYFGVTHQFNDMWTANINTDSTFNSSTGQTNLFIKTAYVQAKFDPALIVQAGSANMPWIPFDEDNYGFRYVENTIIDRLHFGNSADWGIHVLGTENMVSYNVAVVNGGGYKNPTRSNGMDFEGRLSVEPIKGLNFAGGIYNGKLGKDGYPSASTRNATRYDLMGAYTTKQFRVGAEYFWESDWGFTASPLSDKGDGYSLFGNATLSGPFSVFGRWDSDKTSKKLHPNMKENYFNVGLQWQAYTGILVSLVYKHDHIDNPASASTVTKYDEFGVFSQVAF